jgi:hypothetical protein
MLAWGRNEKVHHLLMRFEMKPKSFVKALSFLIKLDYFGYALHRSGGRRLIHSISDVVPPVLQLSMRIAALDLSFSALLDF